ncbi:MAG: M67 family metallopeptidase, partial [Chloroflexota bacterium]
MVPSRSETTEYPTVDEPAIVSGEGDNALRFTSNLYEKMIEHLRGELPNEGCGLIAFADDQPVRIYPGTNVLASQTRYRMDDEQVIQAVDDMESNGWRLGAIYHSHPASPARPSMTDLEEANWPDAMMLIVSFSDQDDP